MELQVKAVNLTSVSLAWQSVCTLVGGAEAGPGHQTQQGNAIA